MENSNIHLHAGIAAGRLVGSHGLRRRDFVVGCDDEGGGVRLFVGGRRGRSDVVDALDVR